MASRQLSFDAALLVPKIDAQIKRIHTTSLDISFNELVDMYRQGELNIRPEFQRLFLWSYGAQSRFVESLLLEMPVPPIYVLEEEDGRYVLIDGLQRISSYLHFRGELDADHTDPKIQRGDFLQLSECDVVPELNGLVFDQLPTALQIRLKRAFVRVEVVRKGSDTNLKYHMFKRLNVGGRLLSEQQVRNCTIRLLDNAFADFVNELSGREAFKKCVGIITDEQQLAAFDQELVLRFFAIKNSIETFKHDVSDFLTEYMEAVTLGKVEFDYDKQEKDFAMVFEVLADTLGDQAFGQVDRKTKQIRRGFSVYHFEGIAGGVSRALLSLKLNDSAWKERFRLRLQEVKRDENFIATTTGGGRNSPGILKQRVEFVEGAIRAL